jgi:hypothetical protein
MTEKLQPWPEVWLSSLIADTVGKDAKSVDGARVVTQKNGMLRYFCPCGSYHDRYRGEAIPETREWVRVHNEHLPPEELV